MKRGENMALTYEWDFKHLYKNDKDFRNDIKYCEKVLEDICLLQGKLNNKEDILKYFVLSEEIMHKISRLDMYVMLRVDKNTRDVQSLKDYETVNQLLTTFSVKTAFVSPEFAQNSDEFLVGLYNDPDFKDYKRVIEGIIKDKPHTISKEKEELIAGMGEFSDFSEIFEKLAGTELKFDDVVVDGKSQKLNDATYSSFTKSKDPEVRRQAYENLLKGYSEFNLTLSHNLLNQIKKQDFISRTYNFSSTFERSLFHEEVEKDIFFNLIQSVNQNLNLYQNYLKAKAKCLGLKKLYASDINAPIGSIESLNLDYENAVEKVLEVVKVLGQDYQRVATNMFSSGVIDVFPSEGKRSGGYSASGQTGHQFILLNYNNSYFDFSTIAHELGHSMHSYYSEKNQPYFNQNYVIFVAEIASTVNEILLAKKLLRETTSQDERRFIADSLLSEFCASVFRQTMFSEFEFFVNDCVNKSIPISYEEMNGEYGKLQNHYFGDAISLSNYSKFEWSRIPHFYRSFYVFKYATGFISAVSIVKQIEECGESYVENFYKKFLSAGSSMDPVSILKLANIDITTSEPYKEAFKFFEELIDYIK